MLDKVIDFGLCLTGYIIFLTGVAVGDFKLAVSGLYILRVVDNMSLKEKITEAVREEAQRRDKDIEALWSAHGRTTDRLVKAIQKLQKEDK